MSHERFLRQSKPTFDAAKAPKEESPTEMVTTRVATRTPEAPQAKKTEDFSAAEKQWFKQPVKEFVQFSPSENAWFGPEMAKTSALETPVEVPRPESLIGAKLNATWASLRDRMAKFLPPKAAVEPVVKVDAPDQPRLNKLKPSALTFGLFSALAMTAMLAGGVDSIKKNAQEQAAAGTYSSLQHKQ